MAPSFLSQLAPGDIITKQKKKKQRKRIAANRMEQTMFDSKGTGIWHNNTLHRGSKTSSRHLKLSFLTSCRQFLGVDDFRGKLQTRWFLYTSSHNRESTSEKNEQSKSLRYTCKQQRSAITIFNCRYWISSLEDLMKHGRGWRAFRDISAAQRSPTAP